MSDVVDDPRREHWRRVEEVYASVVERHASDRAAALDAACAGDEVLRADVESLLSWTPAAAAFIETPAIEIVADDIERGFDDGLLGTQLGAYVVGEWIGSGGMGDVYRARDVQLRRDVALKILPGVHGDVGPHADARIARFTREAQVLASLNHPNVAAIYGFVEGQATTGDDVRPVYALALELVEGPTLAERIARGPLAVNEALPIARQIADGLEAAHALGVIHRDLKPANIKLRPDGRVKILDFGLAKAIDARIAAPETGDATALRLAANAQVSTAFGTPTYMSPEQAQGHAVDQRCDIWAFGAVLYEMLTGRRAFEGRSSQETLAAVMTSRVDWSRLPADTPAPVRAFVMRCLERDVSRRPTDLRDARTSLDSSRGSTISRRVVLTALGASGAVAAGWWYLGTRPRRSGGAVRLPFILPKESSLLLPATRQALAISPDGSQFVYVANRQLFRRSLSELEAHPIPGTEQFGQIHGPVFSSDGESLAFWAESDHTIKRVSVRDGSARTLCEVDNPFGMSWQDEVILFGQGRRGIWRVAAAGGPPERLFSVQDGEEAHGPRPLPDGAVLYTIATGLEWTRWDDARVVVQVPGESTPTTVYAGGSDARYLPSTGHLVFAHANGVLAAGFDVRRHRLTTAPVLVMEGVRRGNNRDTGAVHFSVSDTGRLIYVPGPAVGPEFGEQEMIIADRLGTVERVALPPGAYRGVRASRTGRMITCATDSGPRGIVYTCDLSKPLAMRPLESPGSSRYPIFADTTAGRHVIFQSNNEGDQALYWQPADGRAPAERLTRPSAGESHAPESWWGDTLLFSITQNADVSLWTMSLRDRTPVPFGNVHSAYPTGARFSPDGRWVAYAAEEGMVGDGTALYVEPFPATGVRHRLQLDASRDMPNNTPHKPVWSRDGRELFYVPRLGGFEVVRVTTSPTFSFGPPTSAPRPFAPGAPRSRPLFDMMADGRFVGVIPVGQPEDAANPGPGIQVVLDWFDELQERVPT